MVMIANPAEAALANLTAMRNARMRVINNAEAIQARLRNDPRASGTIPAVIAPAITRSASVPTPPSGGKGMLFNIYI